MDSVRRKYFPSWIFDRSTAFFGRILWFICVRRLLTFQFIPCLLLACFSLSFWDSCVIGQNSLILRGLECVYQWLDQFKYSGWLWSSWFSLLAWLPLLPRFQSQISDHAITKSTPLLDIQWWCSFAARSSQSECHNRQTTHRLRGK